MTFARRIAIGVALVVAMQLSFALLTYLNYGHALRKTSGEVESDLQVIVLVGELENQILEMRAAEEGYRGTGDEVFLDRYFAALRKVPPLMGSVMPLLGDPQQHKALAAIQRGLERWRTTYAEPHIAYRRLHPPQIADGKLVLELLQVPRAVSDSGSQMEAIRAELDRIRSIEGRQIADMASRVVEAEGRLARFLWLAAAVFSVILLAGSVSLLRAYRRKVASLFDGMDAAERGEYRAVPLENGDEVGHIARVFNRMILEVEKRDAAQLEMGRKLAEEAALATETRFRNLLETALDMIVVLGPDGSFRYQSPSVERGLGYRPDELSGRNVFDFVHPEDQAAERKAFERGWRASGVIRKAESRFRRKDGSWRTLEVVGRVVADAKEGPSAVLNVRDVTEHRQLEEQFRTSQKMEAIGRLAGGVAHDFNNLLTVILGYTEALESGSREGEPGQEAVGEIRKAAERAAGLTRQLLAFSRRQVFERRTLNLNALVGDLEKMLRRLIGEDVALSTALDPGLGNVRADAGQIEQVILNLAVNARDAMPQGGKLTIETRGLDLDEEYARHHLSAKPGPYVMIAVSDTGMGMDGETKSRIFEPFFTTKEQGKGTGLGLATVYGIVKQSGGNIWVYSEPGRGTTFKIYLPEAVGAVVPTPGKSLDSELQRGTETILLTEDEEGVRTLARKMLTRWGYTVLEADSAAGALEIARREGPIDLLLTDVVMPEMGGSDLAAQIRQIRPEIGVIYMSGYTDDVVVRHGVLEEGCAFLQKPFAAQSLSRKVREALDGARAPVMDSVPPANQTAEL